MYTGCAGSADCVVGALEAVLDADSTCRAAVLTVEMVKPELVAKSS